MCILGRCVESILQVENELESPVEFELYAKECSSNSQTQSPVRTYDMFGGSPWENIPDLLRMYGMCSYHDWFEYLEFIDPVDKVNHKNQGACGMDSAQDKCIPSSFDAYKSLWWDTQQPYAQTSMLSLFEKRKFQVTVRTSSSCWVLSTFFYLILFIFFIPFFLYFFYIQPPQPPPLSLF